jgi:hypothetical protein
VLLAQTYSAPSRRPHESASDFLLRSGTHAAKVRVRNAIATVLLCTLTLIAIIATGVSILGR